jgi:hypothetical protein
LTTLNQQYGSYTALTVTNLQSLAISTSGPFSGWQSERVSNLGLLADDFEIFLRLSTANTAPANDKAVYVYAIPWIYDGTTWYPGANFSTTTRPTGNEGTCSITDPNSMRGPIQLPYPTQNQPLDGCFLLSQLFGNAMPDGFSLAIRNNCGAALGTGCVVAHKPLNWANV